MATLMTLNHTELPESSTERDRERQGQRERGRAHLRVASPVSLSVSARSCCISFPKLFRPGVKCNHIDKASTRLDLTSLRVRVALCRIPACVFLCTPPLLSSVVQVSDCRLPQWSRMFPPSPPFFRCTLSVVMCVHAFVRSFFFPFLQSHCLARR